MVSKNLFPAVSISATQRILDTTGFKSDKKILKGDLEYKLPENLSQKLSINSVHFFATLRKSWEANNLNPDSNSYAKDDQIYDNQYFRMDFSPAKQVNINTYYRGSAVSLWDKGDNVNNNHVSSNHKLNVDAIIDNINGLNISVRYQGEVQDFILPGSLIQYNHSLYRRLQTNLRIFPGRWIKGMNPFTFELGYNPEWSGYFSGMTTVMSLIERYFRTSANDNLLTSFSHLSK